MERSIKQYVIIKFHVNKEIQEMNKNFNKTRILESFIVSILT